MSAVALHTVKVITPSDGEGGFLEPTVTFVCHGDRTSPCHNYPDGVDAWGDADDEDAPSHVPHDDCWAFDWFDNDQHNYDGPDCDFYGDYRLPIIDREGPIDLSFDGDGPIWHWTEATS